MGSQMEAYMKKMDITLGLIKVFMIYYLNHKKFFKVSLSLIFQFFKISFSVLLMALFLFYSINFFSVELEYDSNFKVIYLLLLVMLERLQKNQVGYLVLLLQVFFLNDISAA